MDPPRLARDQNGQASDTIHGDFRGQVEANRRRSAHTGRTGVQQSELRVLLNRGFQECLSHCFRPR